MIKLVLPAILLLTTLSFSQHKPDWEKIKSLKVAFITEQLDLSSKEAEAFWPLYNKHQRAMHELRKRKHSEILDKLKSQDMLSEQDATILLNKSLAIEEEQYNKETSFIKEIRRIISSKKTILLKKSEEDFKRKLIRQYRRKGRP